MTDHARRWSVPLSSALLFVVQPMMAKSLLPRFGGSAGVWIACMPFFQAVRSGRSTGVPGTYALLGAAHARLGAIFFKP